MEPSLLLAAAAGLLSGATWWRAGARARRLAAAYPPEGRLVAVDGVRIHAVVRGTGPDVVLIHGLSGTARDFTFALVDALAPRYRVIALDRPGLGWSDPVPGGATLAAQARILSRAAAGLGAARPVVVGSSYGGAVALAWALETPGSAAALVLLAAVSHPWRGGLSLYYHLTSTPVLRRLAIPLLAAWVPGRVVRRATAQVFAPDPVPPGYIAHFGPETALCPAALAVNGAQRRRLKSEVAALVPRYPGLALPVEILHGTADATVGIAVHSEPLAAAVPGARLTRLAGTGHMPHHAAQAEVIAAIGRAAARAGLG